MSVLGAAGALAALGLLVASAPAHAAGTTRYVAVGGTGSAPCTDQADPCDNIQTAVDAAASGDTIAVAAGQYNENVTIAKSLTVTGAGPDESTGPYVHATAGSAIIAIAPDASTVGALEVTLNDLAVSSGDPQYNMLGISVTDATVHVVGVHDTSNGTGLWVNSGTVDARESTFSHNIGGVGTLSGTGSAEVSLTNSAVSDNLNTGIEAMAERGKVTVTDSTVSDTDSTVSVTGSGVGIRAAGTLTVVNSTVTGNSGGGVWATKSATIRDTTIADNHAQGVRLDGLAALTMSGSTVSGTLPYDSGAPIRAGLGLWADAGTSATISESTFYGNTGQAMLSVGASLQVSNSTIAGTTPSKDSADNSYFPFPSAAVVAASTVEDPGSVALTGTIVAGGDGVPACSEFEDQPPVLGRGVVTDSGYNLDTDGSCGFTAPSLSHVDPNLGPLADNGGPTKTLLPDKGAATDAIPPGKAGCAADAADQRGIDRPQGVACDIGAVEVEQDTPLTITTDSLPHGKVGVKYSATLSATGGLGTPYVWSLAPGSSLPDGLTLSAAGAITGKPTAAGTFEVTVSVDDPVTKTYPLTVAAAAPTTTPPATTPPATSTPPSVGPSSTSSGGLAAVPSSSTLSGGSGELPETGVPAGGLLAAGLGLLGLGVLLLAAARWSRRRAH